MLKLLCNLDCYTPDYIGKKDILIAFDKILRITEPGQIKINGFTDTVIDCDGLFAFPGLVDQHVHITGGGCEQGPVSRISEIKTGDILSSGITTVVGVLGADCYTKDLFGLLAKARQLDEEGITAFIYTGSYYTPSVTITESIKDDLILIDKVIGVKVALSDHRSSYPSLKELINLSSDAHIGGMIGNKAGVVHAHIGDGKGGLKPILDVLDNTDLSIEQFVPTHINRSKDLFKQGIDYLKKGGNIDLTAGEIAGISVPGAVFKLIREGVDISRVTISSDANGSKPCGEVANAKTLLEDIKSCILDKNVPPQTAFALASKNVAKAIKKYPQKGVICEGSDADILICDKDYNIINLFCQGRLLLDNR